MVLSGAVYTTLIVFVKPDPGLQPITTTTGSPTLMKPWSMAHCTQKLTRASISVLKSPSGAAAKNEKKFVHKAIMKLVISELTF